MERSGAGVTVKLLTLNPAPEAFVIVIKPVVAPAGTVAVMLLSLTTLNVALTPLNLTKELEKKFKPVMATVWPIGPLMGVKLAITGGALGLMFVVSTSLLFEVVGSG